MNLNKVKFEIENIHVELERVEALHRIIIDNYFRYPEEELKPDSLAMYGLLLAYPDYSAVIDISLNYIHDINKQLQAVIDMLCDNNAI